jgi:NADPH-dependent F420 reductase
MTVERVAVIGATGDEGFGLASRWAKAGIEIVVGSRDQGRAQDAAGRLSELVDGAKVSGLENAAAAESCSIVVVTVPFGGQAAIYKSIADSIGEETVLVDCTVPVAASVGGKATHVLGVWQGSAAQQARSLVKAGYMAAAFHSLAAAALNDLESPMEGDVLVCGNPKAKPSVKELVEAIPDLRYVDAGPLENARIVEPITSLLIGINHRYKTDRSGIRITGLPG